MSGYSTVQRDRVLNRHVQVMRLAQPFVSIQLSPSDHVKKGTANRSRTRRIFVGKAYIERKAKK